MKKPLSALILALVLFSPISVGAQDLQTGTYQAAGIANVRIAPRMWSSRLGRLMIGQKVEVRRASNGWCDIKFGGFTHAYVSCFLLKNIPGEDFDGVKVIKDANGAWMLGSPEATVLIEEYGDMQCPFCANYYNDTFEKIFTDYIADGKVKYVYYNFPLTFHAQARNAAMASLCAGDQGRYWQMHELLLTKQSYWTGVYDTNAVFTDFAVNLGMDDVAFGKCMDSGKYDEQITNEMSAGIAREVFGTPAFFVNGAKIDGAQPYEVFKDAIEAALKAE